MLKKSMSREIRADYETQYLFPRSLEEWVGPEDPARFIREFVRALDLRGIAEEAETPAVDNAMGRPHYAFELLLSVWLYAYVNGLRSSREVERACGSLLPMMWLAGTHRPDHNTLWRFWARYRDKLHDVFVQSVKVAIRANAVGMVLHAVDGTKILSRASRRSNWHREDLKKLLAAAETRIEKLESEIAAAGTQDGPDDRLPEQLQNQKALSETIRTAIAELEEAGQEHLNPHDREARMMVTNSGRTEFAYNAQVAVDQKHGIIVAASVTDEANDQRQLIPMLEQVEQNAGTVAGTTLADSGYDTAEALGEAEKRNAAVVVAPKVRRNAVHPYHTMHFRYDRERDSVQCPRGEWLGRTGTRRHHAKPYAVQTYRCTVYEACPVRWQCSRDRNGRLIEITPYHDAVLRHRQRLDDPQQRMLLRKRPGIVERTFAEIKETLGFRRWSVSGSAKVQAQWSMICAAMNLRRLIAT
jgi:transposase